MRNFLRDCSFIGPAFPEPFVQFELETELAKANLLPTTTGAQGRELQALWDMYRRKLRELISGGPRRVRNHVIEPLLQRLGYERISDAGDITTREGPEDGGAVLTASDGTNLRVWFTEYNEDLDAPTRRGAAYRFSNLQVARRVLKAQQERVGLLTNGTELRIIILDLARTDSEIIIRIDPAWIDRRANDPLDSFLLLLALGSPAGVRAIPELVDKARLQQARVTKELRRQAREAVEGFLQEVLNHPDNQEKLGDVAARHALAHELWREALIVVYRLLFVLKLEATDDPARSFKFSQSGIWRNTFSPTTALPKFVRRLLDEGTPSGNLIEQSVRKLFEMFVNGLECSELHVRPLGGTLFGREATPLLSDLKWGERGMAWLLDRLLWTSPKHNSQGRERVHYGSLDVEDLGRVYEALLELEPGVATEDMCRLRRRKLEVVVPVAQGERYRPAGASANAVQDVSDEETEEEVEEEEAEDPRRGRGTKVEWIEHIPAGQFYLRVGLGRKASGSYYTPQSFVKFLVQQTLEPMVAARSPKEDPQPAEILKIKVLDPAMGSGHFLVEACRFLGGKLYEATRLCDERLAQAMRTLEAVPNEDIRAQAAREAADYGQRLAAFLPPEARLPGYLPSHAPEAGESSGISQKQAEAICRRLVAIHCLYGVDKNPLGVELAKVALWLESHSEGFPLTFLDHRLVLGDSIMGPFFDDLLTYPGSMQPMNDLLTQGLRGKFSAVLTEAIALVEDIESTLCSTMPDFKAKAELRGQMETRLAPLKVVAAAWAGGVMLGERCDDVPYAELVRTVAETGNLPGLFESERLREMIGAGLCIGYAPRESSELLRVLKQDRYPSALAYDLSFPEVFFPGGKTGNRGGFAVVLGNPPWDRIEIDTQAYFSEFDLNVLEARLEEREERIHAVLLNERVRLAWEGFTGRVAGENNIADALYSWQKVHVDGRQTVGRPDLYRLFAERAVNLCGAGGYIGWVLPSSFHANEGATGIRRLYLQQLALRYCYSFENRHRLFEIHRSSKFAVVVATKSGPTSQFSAAFYLYDDGWLFSDQKESREVLLTPELVSLTGGKYEVFCEVRSKMDLSLLVTTCRTRVTDWASYLKRLGIQTAFGVELHRNPKFDNAFEEGLITADRYLRCEGEGWVRLPVHSGKTIHQYSDQWDALCEKYVLAADAFATRHWRHSVAHYRFAFRMKASSTNERTFIAALLTPGFVCEQTLAVETKAAERRSSYALECLALANSFAFDFQVRQRVTTSLSNFSLAPIPLPRTDTMASFLVHGALRLSCNHAGYAHLWREQVGEAWREGGLPAEFRFPVLTGDESRWKVRAAIDALVAHAYGFSRQLYEHVMASFSHTSYHRAPALCLSLFDELERIGVKEFTRNYDPYWDIPLNENLPKPLINIPIPPVSEDDGQCTIAFADGTPEHPAAIADVDGGDELLEKLRELLAARHQITNADAQSALACTAAQARTFLKRLVEEHFAVIEGRGRSTRYIAVSSTEVADAHPAGRPN